MKLTRRWRALTLGLALLLASACGLDLSFDLDPADDAMDATVAADASDGPTFADATPPVDASSASDRVDVAAPFNCDQDNDGVRSDIDACGGSDCDDLNPLAKPDSGFVAAARGDAGDWNCDGRTDFESGAFDDEKCPNKGAFDGTCQHKRHWLGRPTCGALGELFECGQSGPLGTCAVESVTKRTVACR